MKSFVLAIIAGGLISSAMLADSDVSGKWSGFPIYLTLKQDGKAVSGSAGEAKGRRMRANVIMKCFAETLSGLVDKPVIDMTDLDGGFNINLEWGPDDKPAERKGSEGSGGGACGRSG